MTQSNNDLLEATKELKQEVHDLSGRLSAKEILHKRTRMLTLLAIAIASLCLIGLGISGYLIHENVQNAGVNLQNAKINCENANSSREANRKIWTLVVNASANDPNRTPQDIQNAQAFQHYINVLYQPRDCNDLDRRYPVPDPPEFKF